MIPRLKPRSSLRRPSGIENINPIDANNSIDTNFQPDVTDASTSSLSSCNRRPEISGRPISTPTPKSESFLQKENADSLKEDEQPLSPSRSTLESDQAADSPTPHDYGNQYKHLLLNYSSTTSNSLETNSGLSYRDFSLTPPTAGSRPPLLVSAKRHASEVRRQHSKRRRKRRRPSSSKSELEGLCLVSGESIEPKGSDSGKEKDSGALCLWKGDSRDECDDNYLPLLESSDEEVEQTDRIEEVVRAEHLKEAMVARQNDSCQRQNGSFSANRAPPPKGCLSNPRPKRPRGQTTRYKTPPKSSDELSARSEPNSHQPRRVQFGIPSAVEYEIDRPPGHLTPMSQEVTRKRYSMDPKEPTREEDEITQETKQNNLILSEWEDQFSTMPEKKIRSHDRSKRNGSLNKRNRRNRRSSSIFSPASRVSLACGHSSQNSPATNQVDNSHALPSSHSMSATDATDLTSQRMPSSNKLSEETNSVKTSQSKSVSISRSVDENQTWDILADLGSINSKGAMELSPHSSTPEIKESVSRILGNASTNVGCSTKMEEKSPPPCNVNFDAINAVGAALNGDSPNHRLASRKDYSSNDSSLSCCERASSIPLSSALIDTPWLDQEWDLPILLRNLSSLREKEENTIQRYFASLDPCIHNSLDGTIAFPKELLRSVSAKSTVPRNALKQNSLFVAKRAILTEWKEAEISYIKYLTNEFDQFRFRIEKLRLFASGPSSNVSPRRKDIEEEISKLETDIHQQKSSIDLLEASIAPLSCVSCQATAQIGIYGFCFQEFRDGHVLELDYMHAIFDVKTRVVVDVNSPSALAIEYIDGASNEAQNSVFGCHRGYIKMIECGKVSFQGNCTELQDSLLRLAQILGRLDQYALALNEINDGRKADVTVDLPHIRLKFPRKNAIVLLTVDLARFQINTVSVSIGGMDFKVRTPEFLPSIDRDNFEALNRIISQFTDEGGEDLSPLND